MRDQNGKRKWGRPSVWLVAGALMVLLAWIGIRSEPDRMQYAFLPERQTEGTETASDASQADEIQPANESGETESGGNPVATPARKALEQFEAFLESEAWGDTAPVMTIHGTRRGATVSRASGTSRSGVTLKMAGPRYYELYPVPALTGQLLSPRQIADPARAVVLDGDLAFVLFGDASPLGEKVQIGENEYTVVGTARPGRSFGSSDPYTAWLPLTAGSDLTPELLTVTAADRAEDGFSTIWRKEAERVFGTGTWIGLAREKVRAALALRLVGLFFALICMKKWLELLKKWGRNFLQDARRRQARTYAVRLIPYYALRLLAGALLLAVTLAAFWGLAVAATKPLQLFPEWVPEKPVALSSIRSRFWSLIAENAVPLQLVTEENAILRFYRFLMRTGVILLLLGVLQTWRIRRRKRDAE